MNSRQRRFWRFLAIVCLIILTGACRRTVKFGVVADIQYHPGGSLATRYYSASLSKLQDCLAQLDKEKVQFVVNLGDTIDHNSESFQALMPVWNKSRAPIFHVLGNHDFDFPDASEAQVLAALEMKKAYYSFSRGKWRFIVLHGFELRYPLPQDEELAGEAQALYLGLRAEGRENAQRWNGGIGGKQMAFLRHELETSVDSGQSALIFCHFPVLPEAPHNLWNDRDIAALLKDFPSVKAYFAGHNHAGDYVFQDGIHYLTFQGLVETPDTTAFAVVTLKKDAIHIKGFGREPSLLLQLHATAAR